MELSYCGVKLVVPTPEIREWIKNNISLTDKSVFSNRAFPGANLTKLTIPTGYIPTKPIFLNKLYWYQGATRWAYGHFLCDADQLSEIHDQVFGIDCCEFNSVPFVMDDGTTDIFTDLYLAYETPLTGLRDVNGMYMITLVDKRYYWNDLTAPLFNIGSGTTWDSLYQKMSDVLGQSITRDVVNSAYLNPSPDMNFLQNQNFCMVLDAIAWNCGQRMTFDLSGKIWAQNFKTAYSNFQTNFNQPNLAKRAGDISFNYPL